MLAEHKNLGTHAFSKKKKNLKYSKIQIFAVFLKQQTCVKK